MFHYGVDSIVTMVHRRRAIRATGNAGLQAALDWLAEHQDEDAKEAEDSEPKALRCNECDKLFSSVALAQLHATKTGHQDFDEAPERIPELTPEQKAAKLAELREKLAEKRKRDEMRAAEEKREAELLRRKSGHAAAEARRELKEREMIKAAEQLRQDREDEKKIRARIRAEMEEERRMRKAAAEKAQRPNAQEGETQASARQGEPIKLVSQDAEAVRIQVKLPGGGVLKAVFRSEDRLSVLCDKIAEQMPVGDAARLTIPFPRTIINVAEQRDKTLMELGLCPSASLVLEQ